MATTRLVLIALDGATLDLLGPWMAQGHLPTLARLFESGAGGVLLSTVPWATPTAFASLMTGVNPGQHGVFDFGELLPPDYTAFVPTNGAHVRAPTLWHLLSEAGLTSGVVNMPMTYPAEAIRGFVVAGIPYPAGSPRLCHPPDLLATLQAQGWDLSRNCSDDLRGNYAEYLTGLLHLVRQRGAATAWLLRTQPPDFLAVHFLETDQAQHRYWQFLPREPRHAPDEPLQSAILQVFQAVDEAVGLIVTAAGPQATVCLMSDHGFGPMRTQVWLNNWLAQHGYLQFKARPGVAFKRWLYRRGLSPFAIRQRIPERWKLALWQFFERQKGRAIASVMEEAGAAPHKGVLDWLTERLALDFYDLDWRQTQAFYTGTTSVGYVWLNVAGRDPQGSVSPADYPAVRAALQRDLQSWALVGEVLPREALWQGAQLVHAPDLVVRWADRTTDARYFQTRFSSHYLAWPTPNDNAIHQPEGLYVWHGPEVRPGRRDARLLDLTPTLLWRLGQAIPRYMEGQVMDDCFTVGPPVTYVDRALTTAAGAPLSAADEEAIRQSLRGLGYLE